MAMPNRKEALGFAVAATECTLSNFNWVQEFTPFQEFTPSQSQHCSRILHCVTRSATEATQFRLFRGRVNFN